MAALVEATDAAPAARTLAELRNNGAAQLAFTNTDVDAVDWLAGNGAGNGFTIAPSTGGVTPLSLAPGGDVRSGGALDQSTENTENASPADAGAIMTGLRGLSLKTTEYAADPADVRRLLPDGFAGAFGLGTADRVSPTDMAGVALVAAKRLDERLTAVEGGGGATGPAGPAGPAGSTGPTGPAGSGDGMPTDLSSLKKASRRQAKQIKALRRANRKLSKRIRALAKRR